jgi:endopeptidase La
MQRHRHGYTTKLASQLFSYYKTGKNNTMYNNFIRESEALLLKDLKQAVRRTRAVTRLALTDVLQKSVVHEHLSGLFDSNKKQLLRTLPVEVRGRTDKLVTTFTNACKNIVHTLQMTLDKSGTRSTTKLLERFIREREIPALAQSDDTDKDDNDDDDEDDDDEDDDDEDEDEDDDEDDACECECDPEDEQAPTDQQRARNMLMIVLGGKNARMTDTRGLGAKARKFFELLKKRSSAGMSDERYFATLTDEQKGGLLQELTAISDDCSVEPLLYRVLFSNIPSQMKNEILNRMENGRESEHQKYTTWLEALLRLPLGKCATPHYALPELKQNTHAATAFLDKAKLQLDEAVYGHGPAKHKLMQFISQRIQNSSSDGMVLGIQGPYGNGKTTLIEKGVSVVLGLPFVSIPLGGASDASFLNGHGFTYEGSVWGQIANVLMTSKVMNPIIYLDELDKISDTPRGREVADQLVHLVDPSQNKHFQDRYFHGLDIDLTKVTWVFSYNDASRIHPVLRDRITEVKTTGFTTLEKIKIANQFLLPGIVKEVGVSARQFSISDEVIEHIVTQYTFEGGVRKLKECLFDIVRDINMGSLRGDLTLANKRRRRTAAGEAAAAGEGALAGGCYDVTIDSLRRKFLKNLKEMTTDVVHNKPEVGHINGLYACANDMGGITPIETHLVPSDVTFGLALTGNLGKVMKESAEVAKTLAWRYLTPERQAHWFARWKEGKASVHVHCPEGAMSKDGPSAGTALTTCILSMLTGNEIRNDVAVTGEINLSGTVMPIGGLRSKLFGAKAAKCRLALFPKENMQDYDKIVEECPYLIDDSFRAVAIAHLDDALAELLVTRQHVVKRSTAAEEPSSKPKSGSKRPASEPVKMVKVTEPPCGYNLRQKISTHSQAAAK